MLWKALQALKSCTLLPNLSPHCAVSQIIYLLILLSWPRESIESLLIKFADEMTRRLENSFGIKNEFNQLEGIYALDKDCTRWPLWSFSTLRFNKKKKNCGINITKYIWDEFNLTKVRWNQFIIHMYVYIYTHTHIHTYICVYIYTVSKSEINGKHRHGFGF